MEGGFLRYGGVPADVLFDYPRALVEHHDAVTREVRFNARLHAYAPYRGLTPRACTPYRARTKEDDERGVGYVRRNAITGRRFASWGAFKAHLEQWTREGRGQQIVDWAHLAELFGVEASARRARPLPVPPPDLLRPLAEHEAVMGGGW